LGGGNGWFLLFYGCFLKGVLKKVGAERGFLMVKLWGFDGITWWQSASFSAAKNMPRS
jgi:hypothetical protein